MFQLLHLSEEAAAKIYNKSIEQIVLDLSFNDIH